MAMDAHGSNNRISKAFFVCLFFSRTTIFTSAVPLPMEFSRQEYWSRMPFPPPGDLPDPGIEALSLASPDLADDAPALHHRATWETCLCVHKHTCRVVCGVCRNVGAGHILLCALLCTGICGVPCMLVPYLRPLCARV